MIKREEVEVLLAVAEEFGTQTVPADLVAELARAWLAVDSAPVVPVSEQVTFPNRPPMDWNDSCFRTSYVRMLRCDESGRLVPEADSGGDRG